MTTPTRHVAGWVLGSRQSDDREIISPLVISDWDFSLHPALTRWSNATVVEASGRFGVHKTDGIGDVSLNFGAVPAYEPNRPYKVTWSQLGNLIFDDEVAVTNYQECPVWTPRQGIVRRRVAPASQTLAKAAWGMTGEDFHITNVRIRRLPTAEWAAYGDRLFAQLGGTEVRPWTDESRLALIPSAMDRLRNGGALKIGIFGDSWSEDTAKSSLDAWLSRYYYNCDVTIGSLAIGNSGAMLWNNQDTINAAVVPQVPDLILWTGISSYPNPQTAGWNPSSDWDGMIAKLKEVCPEVVIASNANGTKDTSEFVRAIAVENEVAFFDASLATNNFLADAGATLDSLMGDHIHLDKPYNNTLLGRGFAAWLGVEF